MGTASAWPLKGLVRVGVEQMGCGADGDGEQMGMWSRWGCGADGDVEQMGMGSRWGWGAEVGQGRAGQLRGKGAYTAGRVEGWAGASTCERTQPILS